jgi:hypothetical protein
LFLGVYNLPLENICWQSFDNPTNIRGKGQGLETLIKTKNKYANFLPCAAHSLDLVGA